MKNHIDNLTTEGRPRDAARLAMVERFRRSGQTRRAFCESEGVAKSTLDWWLRRSAAVPSKLAGRNASAVGFREVALVSAGMEGSSNWAIEIHSPQGWTIRSRQVLSVEEMARLLREPRC
jgi:hypothetical protein